MALIFAVTTLWQILKSIVELFRWAFGLGKDRLKSIDEKLTLLAESQQRIEGRLTNVERNSVSKDEAREIARGEIKYVRQLQDG